MQETYNLACQQFIQIQNEINKVANSTKLSELDIDGKEKYFAIHGGAMNIKNDGVVLLLNSIEEKDEIDIDRANKALERAKERIENKDDPNLDIKRAELALKRALARIDTFNS